jgi:hypothetical protein
MFAAILAAIPPSMVSSPPPKGSIWSSILRFICAISSVSFCSSSCLIKKYFKLFYFNPFKPLVASESAAADTVLAFALVKVLGGY